MAKITREELQLINAKANAVFCPRCSLTPGKPNNMTGWELGKEWKRECFNCKYKWIDRKLQELLKKK